MGWGGTAQLMSRGMSRRLIDSGRERTTAGDSVYGAPSPAHPRWRPRAGGTTAGSEVTGVSDMKVYSYPEARQQLAELLNRARREGHQCRLPVGGPWGTRRTRSRRDRG